MNANEERLRRLNEDLLRKYQQDQLIQLAREQQVFGGLDTATELDRQHELASLHSSLRRAEQRAFVFERAAPPSALRKLLTDLVCFHPDRNPEGLGGDVTKELLAVRARL